MNSANKKETTVASGFQRLFYCSFNNNNKQLEKQKESKALFALTYYSNKNESCFHYIQQILFYSSCILPSYD